MAHTCPAHPCPLCFPQLVQQTPIPTYVVYLIEKGCICPPKSEQTCQRPDCGRKPIDIKAR